MSIIIKKYKLLIVLLVLFCSCSKNNKAISYNQYLQLTNTYLHNTNSFTQGLFLYNNELYETTGLYGQSYVYKNINIDNNLPDKFIKLDNSYFGEGSTIFNNKLYVLTWKEYKVLVYNPNTLDLIKIINYNHEGWGLTTDGNYLIASDGTSKIYFMDEKLNDIKSIVVKFNNDEVHNLNELEYINGYIWANIWESNNVAIINPQTGDVIKMLDFSNLVPLNLNKDDVLNGIAYDNHKIYITGKNWPYLFEFILK